MNKQEVVTALVKIREATDQWRRSHTAFRADLDACMKRLINEAAVNRMSVEEFSHRSGLTPKKVRALMRENNLNPRHSHTLLAKQASETLTENAALLGVEPSEMDLMSPLAYLPVGSVLRDFLRNGQVDPDEVLDEVPDVVEAVEALQRLADECLMHAPNKDAVHEDYAIVHRLIGVVTA